MPELPEVETIRRQMAKALTGVTVTAVDVRYPKNVRGNLRKAVVGAKFICFERRAKLLIAHFSSGYSLVTHLKMTGKYLLKKPTDIPDKHTHEVFTLDSGEVLWFHDVRKFGYLEVLPTAELPVYLAKHAFGPEPLERGFGAQLFEACLRRFPGKRVKTALMQPQCIAGIGNIYADEACFYAGIRPMRRVKLLRKGDYERLWRGVLFALRLGVKSKGASAENYRDLYDAPGSAMKYMQVYGRAGEPCLRCGTPLRRVVLTGRSAHYCPQCQV